MCWGRRFFLSLLIYAMINPTELCSIIRSIVGWDFPGCPVVKTLGFLCWGHAAWYVLAESFLRTGCQGSRFRAQLWTLGAHCRQPSDRTHQPRPQEHPAPPRPRGGQGGRGRGRGGSAAGSRLEQEGAHNVLTRVLCESILLCNYLSHFSEEQPSQKRVK